MTFGMLGSDKFVGKVCRRLHEQVLEVFCFVSPEGDAGRNDDDEDGVTSGPRARIVYLQAVIN